MKKVILVTAILICSTLSFAQSKKETVKGKVVPDSLVTAKPDTITGYFYSFEQNKMIQYKALVTKEEIKDITNCPGYTFSDDKGKLIAYTTCKDFSFGSLIIIEGRELDFINYLRTKRAALK